MNVMSHLKLQGEICYLWGSYYFSAWFKISGSFVLDTLMILQSFLHFALSVKTLILLKPGLCVLMPLEWRDIDQ